MKDTGELEEVYSCKLCPFCNHKPCKKELVVKNKSVTSIKCKNYKRNRSTR